MKKILYGLLSACFIMLGMLSVCTMTASAEEIATGETGGCTYTLTRNEGEAETYTLTISPKEGGDGRMGDYNYSNAAPWCDVKDQITELVIGSGVTTIGNEAFSGCSGLTSVEIPSGVTSIGNDAFWNCSGLTSVEIPAGVTTIGSSAFSGCSGLTSIEIPGSVTSIGYDSFNKVPNIIYDGEATGSPWGAKCVNGYVEGDLIYKDDSKTALCAYIGDDISVTIPESVTTIGNYAFYGCSGLTNVEIPAGVTSIGRYAFSGCSGLTSVEIPAGVTSIDWHTFEGCSGLTSVKIPAGVTSIGNYAFSGCSGLTSIEIPAGVTTIGSSAFSGCSGLTSVKIPSGVTSIGEYAFSYCSGLTSVEIPTGVTSIGDYAFYECRGLTSVEIPTGVTSIGKRAFGGCSSLSSVEIPMGVTSIGDYTFSGCSGLTSVEIPTGVTSIGYRAFWFCESLRSVEIPGSVKSIGDEAFFNCESLRSVEIPGSVKSIGDSAFESCDSLRSVEIPSGVTSIGDSAFESCGLTSVEIPGSVTSIGEDAFSGCSRLTTVYVSCAWKDTLYSFDGRVTLNQVLHDVDKSSNVCNDCSEHVNDWAELKGHSLTLTDEIGLNFVVELGEGAQNVNTRAFFTVPINNTTSKTMVVYWSEDKTMDVDGKVCYVFTCPMAAKQMSDDIKMQLVVNDVSQPSKSYSVRDYAVSVLKDQNQTAAHDVVKAMLNYGAYAQEYFGYNTGDLANAGYAVQDLTFDTEALVDFTPEVTGSNDVLSYAGSTILLESEIKVRHYFKLNEGRTYYGGLKSYVAPDGETVDGTYYYYESEGIKAKELGNDAEYTGVEGITLQYNPLSYVTTVVASTDSDLQGELTLQNLMRALYLYYKEVVAYNGVA